MSACLRAVSHYLPEKILTNADLGVLFPGIRMEDLTRLTGVRQRHLARADETAADMAVEAAKRLFSEHRIDPAGIDFILFNTQWPDYITPSSACLIQDRLNLPQSAGSLDISQGCTGYIYGLSMAKGLIESGSAGQVLLLTSETITKSLHPEDHSNRAIFGDAATASLITDHAEQAGRIGAFSYGTDGSKFDDIIIRAGGARKPFYEAGESQDKTLSRLSKEDLFFMNGPAVFTFSVNITPGLIKSILEKNKLEMSEIDLFIFHQANQIILETIARKNKIPAEKTMISLEDTGNTVSSTIPLTIIEAMKQGRITRGSKVLVAAFGVGLSWGGSVIRF